MVRRVWVLGEGVDRKAWIRGMLGEDEGVYLSFASCKVAQAFTKQLKVWQSVNRNSTIRFDSDFDSKLSRLLYSELAKYCVSVCILINNKTGNLSAYVIQITELFSIKARV